MARNRSFPINRKVGVEGVHVKIHLEKYDRTEEMTLRPGVLPEDVLRERGYDGNFTVKVIGLGRLNS